jgi:uncharacterized lipoprotein YajG
MKKLLALLLPIILLAACSSQGTYTSLDQSSALKQSYETVKLTITPTAENSAEIVPDLRAAIVGQLMATGQFHRMVTANEPADLQIAVDIIDYRQVATVERAFGGAFAGRNKVKVRVTLTDSNSNTVIKSFEAEGESSAYAINEGAFSDAIREVTKQIGIGISS